jgi:Flp pilus assembly protein TadD
MPDSSGTPANAKSLIASGRASLGRKDFDQAVADFTQAIRLEPKSSAAFRLRGHAYASKRDFKAAIAPP